MGRAEFGTPKSVGNMIKAKGLQKLKWYCQICEKQCRDENGFRNHTQGESHQRRALQAGKNASKTIGEFSRQFQADFVRQLRMSHNEKKINANKFYNQYIQNKDHVHMNSTRWHTLTEFVKHLGRSGIVRVEEDEKEGLTIQWVDTSPEAMERADVGKRKERQQQSEEQQQQKFLLQQMERAQQQRKEESGEPRRVEQEEENAEPESVPLPTLELKEPEETKPKVVKKNVFAANKKKSQNKVTKDHKPSARR